MGDIESKDSKSEIKRYIPGTAEEEESKNHVFISQSGNYIYCSDIFKRLEELRDIEIDKDYEEKSAKSKIFNRFSGGYFSPTFVKSFMQCPAQTFINSCIPRSSSEILNFGSCVHKVFERIVREKIWDDKKRCLIVADEEINNFNVKAPNNINLLKTRYIDNFLSAKDYVDESKPFDYDKVQMFPEEFFKDDLSVFDVPLGSCFNLMDRVDVRDEGIFVIDYKTGVPPFNAQKKEEFISSYINQMICYSWMIEKKYGVKPRVFAFIPYDGSYIEFPVKSLKSQSIFVENIINYYKEIKEMRSVPRFEQRINEYCKYCYIKDICNRKNNIHNDVNIRLDLNKIE